MANTTNISGYFEKNIDKIRESIGIPQFIPADVNSYYMSINGIIIQGGRNSVGAILFQNAFPKQVLGVFANGSTASAVTLEGFTLTGSGGYWFAIGV
jgi:gamma-glutamyl-gamma-aminobutyrate hydrolase PuuD